MPERPVAVCRELTKRFEEVVRGTAAEVAERFSEPPKGEITVVVGSAPAIEADESQALEAVAELVAAGVGRRQAAEIVSRLTGVARNRLYRRLSVARFDNSRPPCYRAGSWFSKLATECPCSCSPWLAALVLAPARRGAWTWPVDGPVLPGLSRSRTIRTLAGSTAESTSGRSRAPTVHAPARGVVSFAGSLPHAGLA